MTTSSEIKLSSIFIICLDKSKSANIHTALVASASSLYDANLRLSSAQKAIDSTSAFTSTIEDTFSEPTGDYYAYCVVVDFNVTYRRRRSVSINIPNAYWLSKAQRHLRPNTDSIIDEAIAHLSNRNESDADRVTHNEFAISTLKRLNESLRDSNCLPYEWDLSETSIFIVDDISGLTCYDTGNSLGEGKYARKLGTFKTTKFTSMDLPILKVYPPNHFEGIIGTYHEYPNTESFEYHIAPINTEEHFDLENFATNEVALFLPIVERIMLPYKDKFRINTEQYRLNIIYAADRRRRDFIQAYPPNHSNYNGGDNIYLFTFVIFSNEYSTDDWGNEMPIGYVTLYADYDGRYAYTLRMEIASTEEELYPDFFNSLYEELSKWEFSRAELETMYQFDFYEKIGNGRKQRILTETANHNSDESSHFDGYDDLKSRLEEHYAQMFDECDVELGYVSPFDEEDVEFSVTVKVGSQENPAEDGRTYLSKEDVVIHGEVDIRQYGNYRFIPELNHTVQILDIDTTELDSTKFIDGCNEENRHTFKAADGVYYKYNGKRRFYVTRGDYPTELKRFIDIELTEELQKELTALLYKYGKKVE